MGILAEMSGQSITPLTLVTGLEGPNVMTAAAGAGLLVAILARIVVAILLGITPLNFAETAMVSPFT